jgi:hypothetical protein
MINQFTNYLKQWYLAPSQPALSKAETIRSEVDRVSFEKTIVETYVDSCMFFVKDCYMRKNSYHENPSLLENGLFYTNDHYEAMQEVLPGLKQNVDTAKKEYTEILNKIMQQNGDENTKASSQLALEKYTRLYTQFTKLQNLFDRLYQGGCYFHGYQDPHYFDFIKNKERVTGFEINKFQIKPGFQPTEIVDAFNNGLTFTDCLVSIDRASRYNALRKLWGDEKFNIVFACDSKTAISYDAQVRMPLALFVINWDKKGIQNDTLPGKRTVKYGQMCFIENSGLYHKKHYNGVDGSINILCISNIPNKQLFTGFGLPPEGISEMDINEWLQKSYNAKSINLKIIPKKYHPLFKSDEYISTVVPQSIDKVQYEKSGGGSFMAYHEEFHVDRIWEVAQAPLEKVRALVDSWL